MKLKFLINNISFFIYYLDKIGLLFLLLGDGDPNPELGGYSIQDIGNEIYGAADRFYLSNEYMLERIYIYLSLNLIMCLICKV